MIHLLNIHFTLIFDNFLFSFEISNSVQHQIKNKKRKKEGPFDFIVVVLIEYFLPLCQSTTLEYCVPIMLFLSVTLRTSSSQLINMIIISLSYHFHLKRIVNAVLSFFVLIPARQTNHNNSREQTIRLSIKKRNDTNVSYNLIAESI